MKIVCQCGRDVRHEPPFDDFHVQRVPCTPTCQRIVALEKEVAPKKSFLNRLAPEGYEDEKGFHYGKPPTKQP